MPWPIVMIPATLGQQQPAAADSKPAEAKAAAPAPAAVAPAAVAPAAAAPAGKAATKTGTPPAAPQNASEGNILYTVIMFAPVILVFYMLSIRPQQQQEKKRRELINTMTKGQKVLTSSGIYGTVVSADPASDKVVVRVDDDKGVKLTFSKASIARVIAPAADKEKDKAGETA